VTDTDGFVEHELIKLLLVDELAAVVMANEDVVSGGSSK